MACTVALTASWAALTALSAACLTAGDGAAVAGGG